MLYAKPGEEFEATAVCRTPGPMIEFPPLQARRFTVDGGQSGQIGWRLENEADESGSPLHAGTSDFATI